MTVGEVSEDQTLEIDDLYEHWERKILWQANNREVARHSQICIPDCQCRTRQEEIHEWEDWIIENYDLPDLERQWTIPMQVFTRVSPIEQAHPANVREFSEKG